MEKQTFRIPQWAVVALVNGVDDGLTANGISIIETFINTESINGFLSVESEPYFTWVNDIDNLGGIVYDLSFSIETEYTQ
jgi:hypothetical protein